MKVLSYQKWLVVCLFCVSLLGLILLKPPHGFHKISHPDSLLVNPLESGYHAFALDEEIRSIRLSKTE